MNKFYKEKDKLSFLSQVIDLTVRKSKLPKRITLLEDLNEYLKWEIMMDDDSTSSWVQLIKNIRHYTKSLIYTESLKDLYNPKIKNN